MAAKSNIVLIGMPASGKSTVGVLLAKALRMGFLDTDVYIQSRRGKRLQDIINDEGLAEFCRIEEGEVLTIDVEGCVIATGGSVVYSDAAMGKLGEGGVVVYLKLGLEEIGRRITDMDTRGLVIEPGQGLDELYEKRRGLYEKWAEVTVEAAGLGHQQLLEAIIGALGKKGS